MKRFWAVFLAIVLALAVIVSVFMFSPLGKKKTDTGDYWSAATYTEDTELGEGAKTFTLKVTAEDRSVVFTLHSDADTVGEALTELGLVDGEQGAYGLYIKQVDGMTADYDTDGTYWSFLIDGEMAMTGADSTDLTEGAEYTLAREK